MTRSEMIEFIRANPNVPITHWLFSANEYIYSKENGKVYDEDGHLFEDWHSPNDIRGWNGIRARIGDDWEDGWHIRE